MENITLIVFGIGIIVIIIINGFLCYRIKRYKKRGFYQGHSDQLLQTPGKSEQERDQLLRIPDAVAVENEEPWKELGKSKQERDQFLQTPDAVVVENEVLRNKLGELQNEIDKRKTQYKHAWRNVPLYPDWRKEEFKAVNMTLDAATAHHALLLSEEGRRVFWQETYQEIPSSSQRFISIPCVLGQLRIISGRYSWDVEVKGACSWDLGVCRDNVTRKGRVTMSPKNGFWAIRFYEGEYWALTSPETHLTLREKPFIVRVFLDYEAGDVSFYNMTDESHIFTFPQTTFCGVLRPLFRLWSSESGSLTICAGEECEML
ncbi:butyrophilin subfamily 1 member A1-like isoform X3 [Bubalus bubalis]|uniref:butyrophilin subfamily 1 member A1-like isoform X3 n=1 Tax=Bubalus bubalis TaxID=89462 RepID=UPI001D121C8B|nr:butyrophilin subfamily 1 member A1-like isoform X3 [Bubalus bubalis]